MMKLRIPKEWEKLFPRVVDLALALHSRPVPTPDDVAIVAARMNEVCASREPAQLVNLFLAEFAKDPHAEPGGISQDGQIVLLGDYGDPVIVIGKTTAPVAAENPASVISSSLVGALHADGFDYVDYGKPAVADWSRLDREVQIASGRQVHVPHAQVVCFDPGSVFEYSSDEQPVIKAEFRNYLPLRWEFDRSSGRPVTLSASTIDATTLLYMFRLAAQCGNEATAEAIAAFCKHDFHYVRWGATQALGALHPESALEALKKLAHDPHPEVNAAARKSLSTVE